MPDYDFEYEREKKMKIVQEREKEAIVDSGVERQLSVLAKELDMLSSVVDNLPDVLNTVLVPEVGMGESPDSMTWPDVPISAMASNVRDMADRLRRIRGSLAYTMERVNL